MTDINGALFVVTRYHSGKRETSYTNAHMVHKVNYWVKLISLKTHNLLNKTTKEICITDCILETSFLLIFNSANLLEIVVPAGQGLYS